jgi:dTDP-4-dehydrorhamnose reductase
VAGCSEVVADLRERRAAVDAVRSARPSLVIHAAYAKDEASIVDATRNVVVAATQVGAGVLHVSTDAVFSGDGTPRHEDATPDPVSDYGRWKAEAEQIVTALAVDPTIVRLPLVVSLDPDDHAVARIRHGATRGEPTAWFGDEWRQPAEASELARAVWRIASLGPVDRAGQWHLPGPESLTRFEIAQRVVAVLGLDPGSIRMELAPPTTDRPRHLHLEDRRAREQIGWSPSTILRADRRR